MDMKSVREIAKSYDIKTSRASKAILIKQIQLQEGNFDCFASAVDRYCDQPGCLWRNDCFKTSKKLAS